MKKYFLFISILFFITSNYIANQKIPFGDDVLLIITYNFPHYESVGFLRELYKPWFPNVVFYGPTPHPEVKPVSLDRGCYAYVALADAIQKYPNFKGYFQIHDDCIVNCWNLLNLNKNKIWVCSIAAVPITPNGVVEWNWHESMKYHATKRFYESLNESFKSMLDYNSGSSNKAYLGYSDILYIPAIYKSEASMLFMEAYNNKLFLEIAIPTVVACLDKIVDQEMLRGIGHQNGWNYQQYSKHHQFVHPIKLSNHSNRIFIWQQFNPARQKSTVR